MNSYRTRGGDPVAEIPDALRESGRSRRAERHHRALRRQAAGRSGSARALLLAAAGCALVFALAGRGESSAASVAASTYTLMQTNLCLSGMAGCYDEAAYPAVVEEAVARIRDSRPDAVTINEACRGDVVRIARRMGYHLRFSPVSSSAGPVVCTRPRGRGRFGDAVLTKSAITRSDSGDFAAQAGSERRRWLCVATRAEIDVCTAHLATRSSIEVAGNDGQCAELAAILARHMATRTVIFGGDVNRRHSCAPDGRWTRTDAGADQAPSLQHVYGSDTLRSPSVQVLPATRTDHDVLLVHATADRGGRATTTSAGSTAF